ncbi:MAG: DUF86 domain-containing protein [Phycisphaerales bacterium]|nr:MAG: DUF86 domain-containing protein [Phycisphaerales bacterium]
MSRDDACILDMLVAARRIAEAVENITFDEFRADWHVNSAVQHQLLILGEAVKRLSREFRENHAQIPWQAIAGHRDILIHQYNAVDVGEVWLIARDRIPELVQFLETVAPQEE